jgi:hypothetical protein
LLLLLGWLSSFSHSYSQSLVSEARDTNCVVVLAGYKTLFNGAPSPITVAGIGATVPLYPLHRLPLPPPLPS